MKRCMFAWLMVVSMVWSSFGYVASSVRGSVDSGSQYSPVPVSGVLVTIVFKNASFKLDSVSDTTRIQGFASFGPIVSPYYEITVKFAKSGLTFYPNNIVVDIKIDDGPKGAHTVASRIIPPVVHHPPYVKFITPPTASKDSSQKWVRGRTHLVTWYAYDSITNPYIRSQYLYTSYDNGLTWPKIDTIRFYESSYTGSINYKVLDDLISKLRFRVVVNSRWNLDGYDTSSIVQVVNKPMIIQDSVDTAFLNKNFYRKVKVDNTTGGVIQLKSVGTKPDWVIFSHDSIIGTPQGRARVESFRLILMVDSVAYDTMGYTINVLNPPTSVIPVVKEILKVKPEVVMYDLFGKRVLVSKVSGVYFNKSGLITKKCFNVIK